METQEKIEIEIGSKEMKTLKPEIVEIMKVEIITVGEGSKANDKLNCLVKHSEKDEVVVSSVKYERNKELKISGLWFKLDDEKKIQKGTALAIFLEFLKVKKIKELVGKKCSTTEDDKGYLCFKAY